MTEDRKQTIIDHIRNELEKENQERTERFHPTDYSDAACEVILKTFQEDNPNLYESLLSNTTYQQYLKDCVATFLFKGDRYGYLKDNASNDNGVKKGVRGDQVYKTFVQNCRAIQPDGPKIFSWTKLLLFAAPPAGIGVAYMSAAIKDQADGVKAVNDFFAANAEAVAAVLVSYYVVLFMSCVAQYCYKNRCNAVENNNITDHKEHGEYKATT